MIFLPKQFKNKKSALTAVIAVFLALAALMLPLHANISYAQDTSVSAALRDASCGDIEGLAWFLGCPILKATSWLIFVVLMAVSAFFTLFGNLFDLVTSVTLDFNTFDIPAIRQGWEIARDTANLFFIFILLTIAIATILQIEPFGAKRLLPKLILAAIFINFSFLLTQYVIFSANLMTRFFMPRDSGQLSVMFLAGINPNQMFKGTQFDLSEASKVDARLQKVRQEIKAVENDPFGEQQYEALKARENQLAQDLAGAQREVPTFLTQLVVAMLGIIAFMLVATFALAFAGLSLLIRVVVLWFLMILSPVAFLFFVVPGLSSHAQRWWNELLKQSFFPVAFFFLFGLTVQMVRNPQVEALFQAGAKESNVALISSFTSFTYYTLLIIMLMASVLVAKQMGGVAAQWADKGAKYARGFALGYAGKTTRSYIGSAFRGLEKTEAGKTISRIPVLRGAISGGTRIGQKDIGEYKKQYENLSKETLRSMRAGPLLNPSQKAALDALIKQEREKEEEENTKKREVERLENLRKVADDPTKPSIDRLVAASESAGAMQGSALRKARTQAKSAEEALKTEKQKGQEQNKSS